MGEGVSWWKYEEERKEDGAKSEEQEKTGQQSEIHCMVRRQCRDAVLKEGEITTKSLHSTSNH